MRKYVLTQAIYGVRHFLDAQGFWVLDVNAAKHYDVEWDAITVMQRTKGSSVTGFTVGFKSRL